MNSIVSRLAASFCLAVALGTVALGGLFSTPAEAHGGERPGVSRDGLVLLLKGIYEPVTDGPDLGLATVDLDDGTYSKCDIYRVFPSPRRQPAGAFYVNFDVTLCAYQFRDGAFAAVFDEFVFEFIEIGGELYQVGTAELTISEATGAYRPLVGGSIHMEFATRMIDEVTFDELCFCFISR